MNAVREMPAYQSHKKVWALKIAQVLKHAHPDPKADDAAFEASAAFEGAHLIPENTDYAPIAVDAAWYRKHDPQPGGYYVVYADGYKSFSPAEAFEGGYTAIEALNKGADQSTEAAIVAAGANVAPRITPADIEANILGECYFTAEQGRAGAVGSDGSCSERGYFGNQAIGHPLDLLTICVLVLRNGFTVTGESACASPENFNPGIGRRIARENAVAKIWPLMGYELRSKLTNQE